MPDSDKSSVDIDDLLAEIKNTFLAELPYRLDEMEELILSLRQQEQFLENYESIYRHAHSLKGIAGTYNLNVISTICHKLEDQLSLVQGRYELLDEEELEHWLAFVDLIRQSIDVVRGNTQDFSVIEKKLNALWTSISQKYHGLIVVDSQLIRDICLNTFEHYPIHFSTCTDGYEALGRLLNEHFDLLITSMELPSLDGAALVGALRLSNSHSKNIPSIMLTSKSGIKNSRSIDPNIIITKDNSLPSNLSETAEDVFNEILKHK